MVFGIDSPDSLSLGQVLRAWRGWAAFALDSTEKPKLGGAE